MHIEWRYGERGYRYLHPGAGHACLSCGVCAIAAFSDDDMNDLLEFDGVERFVIYVATMGKRYIQASYFVWGFGVTLYSRFA